MIRVESVETKPNGIAARALAARASSGLPIDLIRVDGGTQSRANLTADVIDEYASALEAGAVFPPVVVFYDGSDHWLADGFHRYQAFRKLGREEIPADIRQGTRRDAVLHSVGANETHGLRRTREDKRRAVLTLLSDAEWAAWGDREIGRACIVDHKTVAKLRIEHLGNSPDSRTVERGGTTYTMNTGGIGKPKEDNDDVDTTTNRRGHNPKPGVKIAVPEGENIVDLCRRGIAMEQYGSTAIEAAAAVGLQQRTYSASRQILMLAESEYLNQADRELANKALTLLVDSQQVGAAWEMVETLAGRVWGDQNRINITTIIDKRTEQFERSFGILLQACMTSGEIDLPYLSADRARKAIRQIGAARGALARLAKTIKDIHG